MCHLAGTIDTFKLPLQESGYQVVDLDLVMDPNNVLCPVEFHPRVDESATVESGSAVDRSGRVHLPLKPPSPLPPLRSLALPVDLMKPMVPLCPGGIGLCRHG